MPFLEQEVDIRVLSSRHLPSRKSFREFMAKYNPASTIPNHREGFIALWHNHRFIDVYLLVFGRGSRCNLACSSTGPGCGFTQSSRHRDFMQLI
jgi:hypothetical protein